MQRYWALYREMDALGGLIEALDEGEGEEKRETQDEKKVSDVVFIAS
jgi:hypothetical protein